MIQLKESPQETKPVGPPPPDAHYEARIWFEKERQHYVTAVPTCRRTHWQKQASTTRLRTAANCPEAAESPKRLCFTNLMSLSFNKDRIKTSDAQKLKQY
jgi:hypothetical protein